MENIKTIRKYLFLTVAHVLIFGFSLNVDASSGEFLKCSSVLSSQLNRQERNQIISMNHRQSAVDLLEELKKQTLQIYLGNHLYQPGSDFLASNESDWTNMPMDREKTDVVIGFGTNSVWDIAYRKSAKYMIIGDWSPLPILAQAYIVSPLIRIAKTPQEFILMISGISTKHAKDLTVSQAFQSAKEFDQRHFYHQSSVVQEFLSELASNDKITDIELKYLTTYFRPKMGDNLSRRGLGPFDLIRHPSMALLNLFYNERYNNATVLNQSDFSVFSSQQSFDYLKSMFVGNRVIYSMTSITDEAFYSEILKDPRFATQKKFTLSITNIFDCGSYNGLTFQDFQQYLRMLSQKFKSKEPFVVFRTASHSPPHGFYRYVIKDEATIPTHDEVESTAIYRKVSGF